MCQLLGMNCNVPTDICFSFSGFHRRGGHTDEHRDGWGIAFYEGPGCRVFLDTKAAAESPVAALVREYPIRSLNVIAHVRKATVGDVALENTHPFVREMWGRYWTFAHNGTLAAMPPVARTGRYRPVGTTDSEAAFCAILDHLDRVFPVGAPPDHPLYAEVAAAADPLGAGGTFNFLLSNGEVLIARCATRLHYLVRRAPFSTAHLIDEDCTVDFGLVTTLNDRVAVIATAPLTDNERWIPIAPNESVLFRDGAPCDF